MDGHIEVSRDLDHVGDGIDITGRNTAAVSPYDAPDEGGVLIVLHDDPSPFRCQGTVDTERAVTGRASHWSHLAAQSLHSPRESGMQYGFSWQHVGQMRRARRALAEEGQRHGRRSSLRSPD